MKSTAFIRTIIILTVAVCSGCSRTGTQTDELITVDITANYPEKTLILQDFMDVEYIPLETTDEFLCRGDILTVGKDLITVVDRRGDGTIFLFNRNGKALRKINRKGQGGEEYIHPLNVTLDENNGELFVNDMYGQKIKVYDLNGNYIRSFPHKENLRYIEIFNFDRDNLICHDAVNDYSVIPDSYAGQSFMLVSKQDGSITKEIQIPFKDKKTIVTRVKDEASGRTQSYTPSNFYATFPYSDQFVLVEVSADTLYSYSPDHIMKPIIVRTPPVESMNPDGFLFLNMLTDRFYFMETFIKGNKFPADLVYDKQEKKLSTYKVYNSDFTDQERVFMKSGPLNSQIASWQILDAVWLVEKYQKGELKGRLKEIAAKLDEESNPVIMLIKHKK